MNNSNSSSPTVEKKPLWQMMIGGGFGHYNEEFGDIEHPFDGDGLPEVSTGFAVGSIVFNVTKGFAQEAPGAIVELWTENLIGIENKKPQPDFQNPEDQEAVMKQANEAQRVRNFNEQAQKPIIHEIKFAKVAGEISSNDEIVQAAGLSSSFNAINEDGTVDAYTQAVVAEAEAIIRNNQKKVDMDNKLALATGKGSLDLRQVSINEGGSALSATKSAG